MTARPSTQGSTVRNAAASARPETDWHRVWSDFSDGMRQMAAVMERIEKTYKDTFVWDRPVRG